jgi:hypothetical protein
MVAYSGTLEAMRKQILVGMVLGALVVPSLVVAQAPSGNTKCQAAMATVSAALKQTSQQSRDLIDQIGAIHDRTYAYYEGAAVPAGQTVPEIARLEEAVGKTRQTALSESEQLPALELRCTPSPALSVAKLNQEVAQATSALKAYRTAVRTELLAIRTQAEHAAPASPSPSVQGSQR